MVLHAGILCAEHGSKITTFDTNTHEHTTQNITVVEPYDFNGVNEMLKSVKCFIKNEKVGCLCICLGNLYNDEIREKLIQAGKEVGFVKVEITDSFTTDFIPLISALDSVFKSKLQNGDFDWVF